MRYYVNYLRNRLLKEAPFPCPIERLVAAAVEENKISGPFNFLFFTAQAGYILGCRSDEQGRFNVESLRIAAHGLGGIFQPGEVDESLARQYDAAFVRSGDCLVFDSYYESHFPELGLYRNRLEEALSGLSLQPGRPLYVAGQFVSWKAVGYCLQERLGKWLPVDLTGQESVRVKVRFSERLLGQSVHLSQAEGSLLALIRMREMELFLPADPDSLAAPCVEGVSWGELLPEGAPTCQVGETACFWLRLSWEVDAFNNLFYRAVDARGHWKRSLLYAPFGGLPASKPASTPAAKPASKPAPTPAPVPSLAAVSPLPEPSLSGRSIQVRDGDVYSFYDLLSDYLQGVEEMRVEDPYIYKRHQFHNLEELISATIRANKEAGRAPLRRLHLATRAPEEDPQRHKRSLESLGRDLAQAGIEFTYEYRSDFHDRCLVLSNGWYVSLGRGLDFFKPAENRFAERGCLRTDIHIVRVDELEKLPRKKRGVGK